MADGLCCIPREGVEYEGTEIGARFIQTLRDLLQAQTPQTSERAKKLQRCSTEIGSLLLQEVKDFRFVAYCKRHSFGVIEKATVTALDAVGVDVVYGRFKSVLVSHLVNDSVKERMLKLSHFENSRKKNEIETSQSVRETFTLTFTLTSKC